VEAEKRGLEANDKTGEREKGFFLKSILRDLAELSNRCRESIRFRKVKLR